MTRQRLALGLIIVTITQVLTSLSELSSATGVGALKLAASRGLVVTYFLLAAALITSIVRLDADVALATLAFVGLSEIKHAILPIEQKGSSAPHDEEAPSRLSRLTQAIAYNYHEWAVHTYRVPGGVLTVLAMLPWTCIVDFFDAWGQLVEWADKSHMPGGGSTFQAESALLGLYVLKMALKLRLGVALWRLRSLGRPAMLGGSGPAMGRRQQVLFITSASILWAAVALSDTTVLPDQSFAGDDVASLAPDHPPNSTALITSAALVGNSTDLEADHVDHHHRLTLLLSTYHFFSGLFGSSSDKGIVSAAFSASPDPGSEFEEGSFQAWLSSDGAAPSLGAGPLSFIGALGCSLAVGAGGTAPCCRGLPLLSPLVAMGALLLAVLSMAVLRYGPLGTGPFETIGVIVSGKHLDNWDDVGRFGARAMTQRCATDPVMSLLLGLPWRRDRHVAPCVADPVARAVRRGGPCRHAHAGEGRRQGEGGAERRQLKRPERPQSGFLPKVVPSEVYVTEGRSRALAPHTGFGHSSTAAGVGASMCGVCA